MLIGYARVSTQDQNLELQTEALTKAGCRKVFEDKVSGSRTERPGLAKAQEALREGDTLVVWKLDRLGRSVKNLVDMVGQLHQQGVQFKSLTDAIDTGTPSGRFFFHVMASLAEMERELTIERTRAGLEVARKLGRKGGRKRQMTDSKIKSAKKLLASGVPPRDVATNLGVSVPTLYRWIPASSHLLLFVFAFACFICIPCHRGEAQQNAPSTPACTSRDLFATPGVLAGLDGFFTVAYDFRNISDHDCSLGQPKYPPSFVPDRVEGHSPIGYKWPSSPQITLLLRPGQTDHLSYRWRTAAADADHPCVQLKWMAGSVLINAPTLLKQVCSDIEGGLYESGPFRPEADQSAGLVLSASKSSFFLDEQFFLTIAGLRPVKDEAAPCPKLFRLARSPDGFTRLDEMTGAGFVGCHPYWPGRQKGNWNTGFPIEGGAGSHWEGLGEHQFQLFEQIQTQGGTGPTFRHTQILTLQIADPSKISRKWGPRVNGVAADVSLDKTTYQLNEDIPLHLAVENFNAADSVRASDPLWDPCSAISIRVLDAHGNPLPANSRQGMNLCRGHGFGPNKEFSQGKLYPIERSLTNEGWLPKEPGTYTIVVTWTPLIAPSHERTSVEARANFKVVPAA
jgi:DNA invertase Pin-like site-specific DNA recombinase